MVGITAIDNSCTMSVRKLGRAMLRPIFDQKSRRDGRMAVELRRALEWWRNVLLSKLTERKAWKQQQSEPVHLFCDASGRPAHLGAVHSVCGQQVLLHTSQAPGITAGNVQAKGGQPDNGLGVVVNKLGVMYLQ